MPEPKADMLYSETARLYEAVNKYNGNLPPAFNALLAGYGINEASISVVHLTAMQKGEVQFFGNRKL